MKILLSSQSLSGGPGAAAPGTRAWPLSPVGILLHRLSLSGGPGAAAPGTRAWPTARGVFTLPRG